MSDAAVLSVRGISKTFGARRALDGRVAGASRRGEMIALIGPSGSGKSTLLRSISGLVADRRRRRASSRPSASRSRPAAGCQRQGARGAHPDRLHLPAVQPGRPALAVHQRGAGLAGTDRLLARPARAVAGGDQGRGHGRAGAGRASPTTPASGPTPSPAASSSAAPSPGPWCRRPRSSWPTSRWPRSTRWRRAR